MRLTLGIVSFLFLALSIFQSQWFLIPFFLLNFFFIFSLTSKLSHVVLSLIYFSLDFLLFSFTDLGVPLRSFIVALSVIVFLVLLLRFKHEETIVGIAVFKFILLSVVLSSILPLFIILLGTFIFIYAIFILNISNFSRVIPSVSSESLSISAILYSLLFVESFLILSYFFVSRAVLIFLSLLIYLIFMELLKQRYGSIVKSCATILGVFLVIILLKNFF